MNPTAATYRTLAEAVDYLNAELFAGQLPPVLVTLQRSNSNRGYYQTLAFVSRVEEGRTLAEIALNPDAFAGRTDTEILSTLAHELCHHWQHSAGQPSRNGYHNAEWACAMERIGLRPTSSDGRGRRTGQKMTHEIIKGGQFDQVAETFLRGAALQWQSGGRSAPETAAKKRASKTKYTCPECGQNAWAKPAALLICGMCDEGMRADVGDDETADPEN